MCQSLQLRLQASLMSGLGGVKMRLTGAHDFRQSGASSLETLQERARWGPSYKRRGTEL